MEGLGILLLGLLIAALILPWVNLVKLSNRKSELRRVERELEAQRLELTRLQKQLVMKGTSTVPETEAPSEKAKATPVAEAMVKPAVAEEVADPSPPKSPKVEPTPVPATKTPPVVVVDQEQTEELEAEDSKDWFSKIAIWVGGVALLMAGFFMIKYSIDSGWLTPAVRVWMTAIFGALLCVAGFVISMKAKLQANARIGQVLAGAGVACLYFAAYAAVHLYGFLGPKQGFVCMVLATLVAVGLSLRNGAPIALMGLVGGFLTPWLMSTGSNDTVMLFSYLFLLFCAAQFLCVRKGWWGLLLGSALGAYGWVATVLVACFNDTLSDPEGALLFVLGICAVTSFGLAKLRTDTLGEAVRLLLSVVRWVVWLGGLAQALLLVWLSDFSVVDVGMLSILSVGALVLALLREDEFEWAGWLALLAVLAAGVIAPMESFAWWVLWLMGMHVLFSLAGLVQGGRSSHPDHWRAYSTVAGWAWVPVLYLNRVYIQSVEISYDSCWLVLSLVSAAWLMLSGEYLKRKDPKADAASVAQAFAFLIVGFGLWATLPAELYGAAAAGLLILASVYWRVRGLVRSELIVGALAVAWIAAMMKCGLAAFLYFFGEDSWSHHEAQDAIAVLGWIGGAGAALLALRLFWNRWQSLQRPVFAWWAGLSVLMAVIAGYQWLDQDLMPDGWTSAAVQGGLTSVLAIWALGFGLLCRRQVLGFVGGGVLTALICLRIVVLHLNDSGAAGESFFFNALLWQFGLPFVVISALAWLVADLGRESLRRAYQVVAMVLGFVWASFLVQDYFGGSHLLGGNTMSTEMYTYSVVWLLLAVAYQAIGLLRDQKALHVGSLVLLLLTVGKVFFVDASELEGLYRVLSFLGLGCVLIGIGFFYNKVVFGRRG